MTVTWELRAALDDLVARYALLVDRRDLDSAVRLFTEDACLILPDPPASAAPVVRHAGRAAVRAALDQVLAVPRTFHALAGQVYDAGRGSDTATGTVACVAHHLVHPPGREPLDVVWHLRYEDRYDRGSSGWRIAERSARIELIHTAPVRSWPEPTRATGIPSDRGGDHG